MGQENNIDNLFKAKLAGRESAAAYSASAWAGADKALGSHFKLLLLKKAAFILIPLLVISGAGAWYFAETSEIDSVAISHETPTENTVANDIEIASNDHQNPQENTSIHKAAITLENANATNSIESIGENHLPGYSFEKATEQRTSISKEANEVSSNSVLVSTKRQDNISANPKTTNAAQADQIAANTNKPDIKLPNGFDALLDDLMDDEASGSSSAQKNELANTKASQAIASKDFMYGMPIFNLKTIGKKGARLAENSESVDFSELPQSRKIEFGANAGLVGATSLENNLGGQSKLGLGVYAGLNIQYHVKPRLFLYSAAILNTRNALGSKSTSADPNISVFPSQLVYLDIPLHVGYRFGARHGLSFGMTFSPLITAINEDRHIEDYGANPTTSFSKDGFANFDVAGSVNYNFGLTKRIDFNAAFRFGLFDVTDDIYFRTDLIDDRNHQLRLGINYRFRAR